MTTSSPFYTAEHEAFRDSVRAFVRKEIEQISLQGYFVNFGTL